MPRRRKTGGRMTDSTLGRFERMDRRTSWSSRSSDFAPWLARLENQAGLSDTLRVELEARERPVGQYVRARGAFQSRIK
jgi:hypothetical protein